MPLASSAVIDFEDLPAGGSGTPATVLVIDQYAAKGIKFNGPVALDYSKGVPVPGFAHSGTKAIELCYGEEFCTTPLEMHFTSPQSHVKVWVGLSEFPLETRTVILQAFDATGSLVAQATTTLSSSTTPQPIRTLLEVISSSANITSARVSYTGALVSPPTVYNNFLAIDDVEVYASPTCAIELNRTGFVNGDTGIAQVLQVTNPTASPVAVEFKLWFVMPGRSAPIVFVRGGADGSFVLRPGFNQNFGPLTLFTVQPTFPRGTYGFNCRFLDPVSGRVLSEDLVPFTISGDIRYAVCGPSEGKCQCDTRLPADDDAGCGDFMQQCKDHEYGKGSCTGYICECHQ